MDEISGLPPRESAPRYSCALVALGRCHRREPHSGSPGPGACAESIGAETCRALSTGDFRRRRITSTKVLMRRLHSLNYMLDHPHPLWFPTESEKVADLKKLQIQHRVLLQRIKPCDPPTRRAVSPSTAEPIAAGPEPDP